MSDKLHVVSAPGTCSITATKAADNNYNETTSVAFQPAIFDKTICGTSGAGSTYTQSTANSSITIQNVSGVCSTISVTTTTTPPATDSVRGTETKTITKSDPSAPLQTLLTLDWKMVGNLPVPWTDVSYYTIATLGHPSTFVDFHPLQLCNTGVSPTDISNYHTGAGGLFPGDEGMCLVSSQLQDGSSMTPVSLYTGVMVQREIIATNVDVTLRKT